MQPETIAARLWPGRSLRIEPLGGGITNHNFKVSLDGDAYVLRIGGRDTGLLGIERPAEREAAARAADVGTAPEVVAFLADEGVLVTRFVAGGPAPPEWLRTADGLARVVAALKPFHEGPPITASRSRRRTPPRRSSPAGSSAHSVGTRLSPATTTC